MRLLLIISFFFLTIVMLNAQDIKDTRSIVEGDDINEEPKGKIALLIGNADYSGKNSLCRSKKNCPPVNDVEDLGKELRKLNFKTIVKTNLGRKEMIKALDEFHEEIESGNYDLALFHFSGHGSQVEGVNYLYPIDGKPQIASDAADELISINRVVGRLDNPNVTKRVIILDACRNNPFTKAWNRSSLKGGLAEMELPENTLFAMAAAPGKVAANISLSGRHGLFTETILQHIGTRDLSIGNLFGNVSAQVSEIADSLGLDQKPHRAATGKVFYLNSDMDWKPEWKKRIMQDTTITLEIGGLSASVGVGGTLLIAGLIKMKKAKDQYAIYETNRNPEDNVYVNYEKTTSRSKRGNFYDAIDKSNKQGSTLSILGGAVALGGGFYFVNKIMEKKRRRKGKKGTVSFLPEIQGIDNQSLGLKMVYNFKG